MKLIHDDPDGWLMLVSGRYSQEIGRAGRDGKASVCEMLPCSSDIRLLSSYVYSDTPSLSAIRGLMSEVWGPAGDARLPGDVISVSLYDQVRHAGWLLLPHLRHI